MINRTQLEQALNNPNVRQFLNYLSHTEGTTKYGYNTAFGGGFIPNLSAHPGTSSQFMQTNGQVATTSAAGRYQFIKGTWNRLARQYGLSDFGPHSQDLGAAALLAQNGALSALLNGDFRTAIVRASPTWASLPASTYAQPKKSWQDAQKFFSGQITVPSPQQGQGSIPAQAFMQFARVAPTKTALDASDFMSALSAKPAKPTKTALDASDFMAALSPNTQTTVTKQLGDLPISAHVQPTMTALDINHAASPMSMPTDNATIKTSLDENDFISALQHHISTQTAPNAATGPAVSDMNTSTLPSDRDVLALDFNK